MLAKVQSRVRAQRKRDLDEDDVGAIYDVGPPLKCFRAMTQGVRILEASLATMRQDRTVTKRILPERRVQTPCSGVTCSGRGSRRLEIALDIKPQIGLHETPQARDIGTSHASRFETSKISSVTSSSACAVREPLSQLSKPLVTRRQPRFQAPGPKRTLSNVLANLEDRQGGQQQHTSFTPLSELANTVHVFEGNLAQQAPQKITMLDVALAERYTAGPTSPFPAGNDKSFKAILPAPSRLRRRPQYPEAKLKPNVPESVFTKSNNKIGSSSLVSPAVWKQGVSALKPDSPSRIRTNMPNTQAALKLDIRASRFAKQAPESAQVRQGKALLTPQKVTRSFRSVPCSPKVDIRLQALNKTETSIVKTATLRVPQSKIIAQVKEANIVLRGEDIVRLRGRRWLNDEVINSFVALINIRNKKHFTEKDKRSNSVSNDKADLDNDIVEVSMTKVPFEIHRKKDNIEKSTRSKAAGNGRPRTYAFNSFFLTRLCQNDFDYEGVRKWPERAGVDVGILDLILVPVNLRNYHWVLAAVDIRNRELLYFDSMYGSDSTNVLGTLGRWLFEEIRDKHGEKQAEEMDITSWKRTVNPSYLPRQHDDGSCGLFTLYTADYLELGRIPDYSQDDMAVLRQRTILFLTQGSLPES
jgi:Ulp1 protease family, C-terminal catalytic domain